MNGHSIRKFIKELPTWEYVCPVCRKRIDKSTTRCKYCNSVSQPEKIPPRFLKDPQYRHNLSRLQQIISIPNIFRALPEGWELVDLLKDDRKVETFIHQIVQPTISPKYWPQIDQFFTVIFSDGFESGPVPPWDGTYLDAGCTFTIIGTNSVCGLKHGKAYIDGDAAWDNAYVYETFGSSYSEVYSRFYFQYRTALPPDQWDYDIMFKYNDTGDTTVARLLVENNTGSHWRYKLENRHVIASDTGGTININTWYCVEIYIKRHATAGILTLWIDGTETCSLTGQDTGDNDIQIINLGTDCSNGREYEVWFDCFVAADARIYCAMSPTRKASGSTSMAGITKRIKGILRKIATTLSSAGVTERIVTLTRKTLGSASQAGITDRIIGLTRKAVGTISLTGITKRIKGGLRRAVGAVGFAGATERVIALTRKITSSIGTAAVAKTLEGYLRKVSGLFSQVGAVTRITTLTRKVTSAINLVGVTERIKGGLRKAIGAISLVGVTDRIIALTRKVTGIISQVGITKRTKGGLRWATSSFSQIGNAARMAAVTRLVSDVAGLVGATERVMALTRKTIGSVSFVGATERAIQLTRAVVDGIGVTAATKTLEGYLRKVSASISPAGVSRSLTDFIRRVAPSLALTGAAKRIEVLIRKVLGAVSVSALLGRTIATTRSLSVVIRIAGIGTKFRGLTRTASSVISIIGTVIGTKYPFASATVLRLYDKLKTIKRASGE